jgi:hypothetical protein
LKDTVRNAYVVTYFTNQGMFDEAIRSSFDMPKLPGIRALSCKSRRFMHLRAANIPRAF